MNWSAIGALAELVGALGVIASLVYLARQVRAASSQARQEAIQALALKQHDFLRALGQDPGTADLFQRGLLGLDNLTSEAERTRFGAVLLSLTAIIEEMYHHRIDGEVEQWRWESFLFALTTIGRSPGFKSWWSERSGWVSRDFYEFFSAQISKDTVAPYRPPGIERA